MGITDLWSILAPGFDKRISFPIFVSKFIQEYGRTPRLAIDAYIFIFQSNHSNIVSSDSENDIQLRNIMSKLMYLTLFNVSYVVIFDGRFKPKKLRHGEAMQSGISYDDQLTEFQNKKFGGDSYSENTGSSQFISRLKEILRENKIDFIQSPGEGEAECARLQKFGVVDFVLTEDTDVFVFGATNVLRNFRKSEQDINGISVQTKDYYVTPVDMQKVTRETGLDNKRLVLIATLRGGDYSNGMNNIGITRATKIALCGTKFAVFYNLSPRKTKKYEKRLSEPLPDFSKMLISCFIEEENYSIFDPYALIKNLASRTLELRRFIGLLNRSIKSRSREVFDMDIKFSSELFIDEYYTLLYLFPIVSPKIFKFLPGSLSFGERNSISNDLHVPKSRLAIIRGPRSFVESVPRFNNYFDFVEIGILKLNVYIDESENLEILNTSFERSQNLWKENCVSVIPTSFKFNLKSILVKILSLFDNFPDLSKSVKIVNFKVVDGIEFVMLKYNPDSIETILLSRIQGSLRKRVDFDLLHLKGKLETIWFPKNLIELINFQLIRDYETFLKEYDKQVRKSPRKFKSTQRTTLDSLGLIANTNVDKLTEKKNLREELLAFPPNLPKPLRISRGSPRRSPRRSPRKSDSSPGQSYVTSFFFKANPEQDNPFIENSVQIDNKKESLFVSDISDNEIDKIKPTNGTYNDLKLNILLIPKLSPREQGQNQESSILKRRTSISFDKSPPSNSSKRRNYNRDAAIEKTIETRHVGRSKRIASRTKVGGSQTDAGSHSNESRSNSNSEIKEVNDSDSDVNTSSLVEISFRSFNQHH